MIKSLRQESSSELSVSMIGFFLFASTANTIRFLTLSYKLDPNENFFGETNFSLDYLFQGMTVSARFLFFFKMWIVFRDMPPIFQIDSKPKNNSKCYYWATFTALICINLPWLVVACIEPTSKNGTEIITGNKLIRAIIISTWIGYVYQFVTIIISFDVFRRMRNLQNIVPILKTSRR
jgi:hypothetical protein